jgi:hypothetical protein
VEDMAHHVVDEPSAHGMHVKRDDKTGLLVRSDRMIPHDESMNRRDFDATPVLWLPIDTRHFVSAATTQIISQADV